MALVKSKLAEDVDNANEEYENMQDKGGRKERHRKQIETESEEAEGEGDAFKEVCPEKRTMTTGDSFHNGRVLVGGGGYRILSLSLNSLRTFSLVA